MLSKYIEHYTETKHIAISLGEGFDYIACELTSDEPLAEGEDLAFRELPPSGERHSQAATAEVDFNTRWTVNGQSQIPPTLFGVTAYNAGSGMTTRESFDEVKQLGVGMLYGGLNYEVGFPPPVNSEGQPADYEAIWRDYEQNFASEARWRPGYARLPLQMAASAGIDYVVHLNIGGWGVQSGSLVKGVSADVDDYTNKLVRLVEVIKKHAPELEFVSLGGETEGNLCESALLRPPGYEDRTGAELYGIVTRIFGQKVHQEFPDIKILGPEN